jgi:hypothetical protein
VARILLRTVEVIAIVFCTLLAFAAWLVTTYTRDWWLLVVLLDLPLSLWVLIAVLRNRPPAPEPGAARWYDGVPGMLRLTAIVAYVNFGWTYVMTSVLALPFGPAVTLTSVLTVGADGIAVDRLVRGALAPRSALLAATQTACLVLLWLYITRRHPEFLRLRLAK